MKFTAKTEYGLVCLIYMARQLGGHPLAVKELVKDERYSQAFVEKIFQQLKRAGIVISQQGNQGGFELARPASQITLKEIVEALEGHTFDVFCEPEIRKDIVCNHINLCQISPLWYKTKEILDQFFGGITLEMAARNEIKFQELVSPSHK